MDGALFELKVWAKLCARNLGQTRIRPVCSQTASSTETRTQVHNDENDAFSLTVTIRILRMLMMWFS